MAVQRILSIVLTAHNCEAYLDNTLSSLVNSLIGFTEGYEIILINDASIDSTAELLQQFADSHSDTHLFQVDFTNIGKVRNFGVQQCSGDYITMIDGDDLILPHALAEIMGYLANTRPDLLLTHLHEIHDDDYQDIGWSGLRPIRLSPHQAVKKFLIHKDFQAHFIGQFIKRELLLAYPFPDFCCYEDAYLFPTILSNSQKIIFSRRGHYLYLKRNNSLSNQINEQNISLLIEATTAMDDAFGAQYANLIACHWINILLRYGRNIQTLRARQKVTERVKSIRTLAFLLDPTIRLSFKRKFLKVRHGK